MQAQAIDDCQNPSTMPPEVAIVIGLQCALFSLFGLVLTMQTVQIVRAPTLDPQQVQYIWKSVSWYYSLLSISAKLILEWGFIALLASPNAQ
jgi:cytosine/uracil/thiamine/allantoin permease